MVVITFPTLAQIPAARKSVNIYFPESCRLILTQLVSMEFNYDNKCCQGRAGEGKGMNEAGERRGHNEDRKNTWKI